jgi:pimeloyl-ACP methyl ester carboxylesterase
MPPFPTTGTGGVGLMPPLADEVLRLADGRLLAWTEWGDPRGTPVVFLHPCPGSRMFCPDEQTTAAHGVRLITVDRPGYGESDPVAEPSLSGFAMDLERLADHLWLGQFPVVGWSGGGPYAAACAARLGERVSALALVAAPAPGLSPLAPDLRRLAGVVPPPALTAVVASAAAPGTTPDGGGEGWTSPSDAAARRQPGVEQALRAMWAEGLRAGPQGLAADVLAGQQVRDFAPSHVRTPTRLFYGDDDPVVALSDGRWWEQALPDAHLRVLQGGHLLPVMAWPQILSALQR